jgi:ketosteroid isomerase-like protein
VSTIWDCFEARNWAAARALMADDLVVELPATGERFRSADAYVAFNAEYPEGWTLQVHRVVSAGRSAALDGGEAELVVSEVQVPHDGVGLFAVAQLAWVRDGLLVSAREFWVTCGEDAPAWRAALVERYDGRLTSETAAALASARGPQEESS